MPLSVFIYGYMYFVHVCLYTLCVCVCVCVRACVSIQKYINQAYSISEGLIFLEWYGICHIFNACIHTHMHTHTHTHKGTDIKVLDKSDVSVYLPLICKLLWSSTGFCIILATGRQSHFQIWKSMFKGTTNHNFYSTAPSHRNGRLGYIHSLHSNTDKVSSLLQVFCKILYLYIVPSCT